MSLSDPIGDMIARIKNAQLRNHKVVELPSSNFKISISEILKNEGYIIDYKINEDKKKPVLSINLKYHSGNPVISTIERISKPGRRIFSSAESLPKINNGLGIAIISTPKGVMTDLDARKQKIGGEIICKVFLMSKIGKINISIPDKVKVALNGSVLNVDGPLGKKSLNIDINLFDLKINDGKEISLRPKKLTKIQKDYGA